jgi:hypothetical protein
MEYQIITDGAADITKEEGAKRGIVVVPFYVYSTQDVNRKFADADELYEEMLKNPKEVFKTACPSPEEYYRKFRAAVDEGKGVFCVTISQKFSGSYSSAVLAANMIAEETPDAKVRVIDSQMNSALQGLFVDEIEKMAQAGLSFQEISRRADALIPQGKIMFTVGNLDYLRAGGRIGALKYVITKTLSVRPLITMQDGDIKSGGLGIGIHGAMKKVVGNVADYFSRTGFRMEDYSFVVGYGADRTLGEKIRELFYKAFPDWKSELPMKQITEVSAVHTGPSTVGFGFLKKTEV